MQFLQYPVPGDVKDDRGTADGEKTMWVFLFALWIVLNGRVTIELVIFGVVIASAVTFFANRVTGYSTSIERRILRNFPVFLLYILNLIWEIIKASASVMDLLISRGRQPDPVIVEFDSEFTSSFVNVLLANSITLTPGTYTVFHKKNHFAVHCLIPEFAEGIEDSSFVRILRKLR